MLELKNISFGVEQNEGDKEIIRDISLTIPDDKLIVVTGPNGGGKSTWRALSWGSKSLHQEAYGSTVKTSQIRT